MDKFLKKQTVAAATASGTASGEPRASTSKDVGNTTTPATTEEVSDTEDEVVTKKVKTSNKKRVCKFTEDITEEFPFLKKSKLNEGNAYCESCRTEFVVASGRYDINRHITSEKHKKLQRSAAGSSNLNSFFKPHEMGPKEKKTAMAEAVFSFHTINHNQSFRSMDCTSKLIQALFDNTFSCARTKTEAIIKNVLLPLAKNMLKKDLDSVSFLTAYTDASNHKDTKLFPIVIRYFNENEGVQVKLLEFSSLKGETSEIISNFLLQTLKIHDLDSKLLALCADNTNANFGGASRKGITNVLAKLNAKLDQTIIGVGCAAHIVNNAIRTAADLLPIDVDAMVKKIYGYFYIYTVRVESLKVFCDEADVEYHRLLGYCETRWLALMPALERLLQLWEPLKSYFLSIDKCPVAIENFFNNESSEIWVKFMHNQAAVFHNTIKAMEGENVTVMQVNQSMTNLKNKLKERLNADYLPIVIKSSLSILNESGSVKKDQFLQQVKNFYANAYNYLDVWTVHFKDIEVFNWTMLNAPIEWTDIENNLIYLSTNFKAHNIDENELFDEVTCLKSFVNVNKTNEWENNCLPIDQRWIEIFRHFKTVHVSYKNLKKIVEYCMCLPGTNASTERVFSMVNKIWTSEKTQLGIDTIKAILIVRNNYSDCKHFLNAISSDEKLLKQIHSSEKYCKK